MKAANRHHAMLRRSKTTSSSADMRQAQAARSAEVGGTDSNSADLNQKLLATNPEESSGKNNAYDNLQALEEVRQDAEKGMFMFDGAVQLLAKQMEDSASTGICAICKRRLGTRRLVEECTRLLNHKRETVLKLRNDEAVCLHETCMAAIKEIVADLDIPPGPNATKAAVYLRTGELSEWRQQKIDCMAKMSCFACNRPFSREEIAAFLSRVDHQAAAMERELHMHPKFCPVPADITLQTAKMKDASNKPSKRAKYPEEIVENDAAVAMNDNTVIEQ